MHKGSRLMMDALLVIVLIISIISVTYNHSNQIINDLLIGTWAIYEGSDTLPNIIVLESANIGYIYDDISPYYLSWKEEWIQNEYILDRKRPIVWKILSAQDDQSMLIDMKLELEELSFLWNITYQEDLYDLGQTLCLDMLPNAEIFGGGTYIKIDLDVDDLDTHLLSLE